MPHYDYVCSSCDFEQEIFQKITEKALVDCPECLALTFKRRPGRGSGLIFQCGGFYETNYNDSKPSHSESCCSGQSSS